jgi:hypothetical protein
MLPAVIPSKQWYESPINIYKVNSHPCLSYTLGLFQQRTNITLPGGEPPDQTVAWQYALADSRAAPSGGVAGAVAAGKSIWSDQGGRGV